MRYRLSSDKLIIFSYFIGIILAGSFLLMMPFSWTGPYPLKYIDALFTSTSAVCVTGLITVDTALYSRFGQAVIALLIQFGGLGIITFATIYVAIPRKKISMVNRAIIKDYYLESVEFEPKVIIKNIIVITLVVEGLGTLVLFERFRKLDDALFIAVFHAVSAFCNAGFSTFTTNLEGYVGDPAVNIAIMGLIVLGGLGFIVIRDVMKRARRQTHRLSTHSRIALATTAALVIGGAVFFFVLESGHALKGLPMDTKILASLFMSVTPRTAGFDTVLPSTMSDAGILMTMLLMFIGACPGSTGGGIKATTFFVLVITALRGVDEEGKLVVGKRSIGPSTIIKAMGILGKGVLIVLLSATVVLIVERQAIISGALGLVDVLYEVISAFGTVGLSLGITSSLLPSAKLVIILTMFAGRVGLFAMSLPNPRREMLGNAHLPEADVMVG